MSKPDKPPYRVPSMAEVAATPPNGMNVISTFSGCGGSSLGYRMAGFRVLGANEFVEAAADVYRANASPDTVLWPDDVRALTGARMLADVGLERGELDVLDGSPPCSSFSMAGKRSQHWGEVKAYSDTAQRTDDLFYEYARLIEEIQPRAFVAENVRGLTLGAAKGYFINIHRALEACGYQVTAAVLDASWLGVPQARQRLIFLGIRNDLGAKPTMPKPMPYRYTLANALGRTPIVGAKVKLNRDRITHDRPMYTITSKSDEFYIFDSENTDSETGASLTRAEDSSTTARVIESIMTDPETRKHLDFTKYAIGPEWAKLRRGERSDRYFQLYRPRWDEPFGTVVASGGNIGLAHGTHPDYPRKLNLWELRRICSFPDDFILTGTYEQRWERLGRSVPPLMMKAIAEHLADQLADLR